MTEREAERGPSVEADPDSRFSRIWRHPLVRWTERVFWVVVALFVFNRLGPQISAWTGIGPVVGDAPAFTITTLDGDVIQSEDLAGKTVVLNFWATWCGPCRLEIPALQAIHEEFDESEVVVLGLSTDVIRSNVPEYLAERGVTYAVGMADSEIRRAFGGISAIPTTLIIDPDGVVRHKVLGLFAPPAMRAAVRRAVANDREPPSGDS